MKHEIFDTVLNVTDSNVTFEKIYKKEYVPMEYLDEIKKANLLIIPNENFRDKGDVLFPETTREFLDFIREFPNDEVIVDIAISDEDFKRIELHSAVIEVAPIIVQMVILPIAVNIISSFLYDLVKKYHRKSEDISAKVQIIAEETATKKSKKIIYEGPVSGIKEALDQAAKDLFSNE